MLRRFVAPRPVLLAARFASSTNIAATVAAKIKKTDTFAPQVIESTVNEFLAMDFDWSYLKNYSEDRVAEHVRGYLAAKATAAASGDQLFFKSEHDTYAYYLCSNNLEAEFRVMGWMEKYISKKEEMLKTNALSVASYKSKIDGPNGLILFTIEMNPFINTQGDSADPKSLTTKEFLARRSPAAQERYFETLRLLQGSILPVYQITEGDNELILNIGFQPDRLIYLISFASLLSKIKGATVSKKFVETFSNGNQIYTFYIKGATKADLARVATLIGLLPNRPQHPLSQLYNAGQITEQEVIYGYAAIMFAHHFTPPTASDDFQELARALKHDEHRLRRLKTMRNAAHQELMSESLIAEQIASNIVLFRELYADFERGHSAASFQKLSALIAAKTQAGSHTATIWNTILRFNKAVVRTNFFKDNRAAVAYRLDPSAFLADLDFPRVPYGIYLIMGAQFRGFHVRFHDIARGGIRMILSRTTADYTKNKRTLFLENYNLAHTQMLKNKDIPESGSKGTVLVSTRANIKKQNALQNFFLQYVDSLIDNMLVEPGVRDTLGKPELLFLGPDENTAGKLPSLGALHAKARGFPNWKSLTTGKDPDIGGIPHDVDGMTTRGVRQYVLGIYEKHGLKQENVVKFMTGGPDGDLGSNEIKQGKEQIRGMCDGKATIFDPNGLNRAELLRLAEARLPLDNFDRTKLSADGFIVLVTDTNVTLPDGSVVKDGATFRNNFHLLPRVRGDIFVPCGGRPASVDINNVNQFLVDAPGVTGEMMLEGNASVSPAQLKFKYIVEGANLFITQDARLALENCGVVLFKDSSSNKGGVTSSSIEVYTGLCLNDEEFLKHMCVKDPAHPPRFYKSLVQDIINRIQQNARMEFDCIWRDSEAKFLNGSKTLISDALSRKIVTMVEFISNSNLHEDKALFRYVLSKYTPATVLGVVPLDEIIKRVPEAYLRAIFEKYIASTFVYSAGMNANEFTFFRYMRQLVADAEEWNKKN
jgi:glutamate dehydrogenase